MVRRRSDIEIRPHWSFRSFVLFSRIVPSHALGTRGPARRDRLRATHGAFAMEVFHATFQAALNDEFEALVRDLRTAAAAVADPRHDDPDAADAPARAVSASEEHGPTNVYMAKDKNAGMNWNDAGPHRISSTSTL